MGVDAGPLWCHHDAMVRQNVLATDWTCLGCMSFTQPSATWMIYRTCVQNHTTKHVWVISWPYQRNSDNWRSVGCCQTQ